MSYSTFPMQYSKSNYMNREFSGRVVLTGSNGFVGRATLSQFEHFGFEVIRVIRQSERYTAGVTNEIAVAEIGPATNWSGKLDDVSAVIHLAARVHVMSDTVADPLSAFRTVNVEGTLNLARQAATAGVRRFVFVSSVKVNGEGTRPGQAFTELDAPNPQDPYGVSKNEAELGLREIAQATGMEVVIIRPPLVYGPGVKANFAALMKAVRRGIPLPLGAIQNQRSLVALGNLVDFILTCTVHPKAANQTFLVSDGHDLSTPELVRGMAQGAGVKARLLPFPVWALKSGAALAGKREALDRLCGNFQVDIGKARRLLEWVPPLSVDEGLRASAQGYIHEKTI
jgi:nucleoside-diphosphate-sugar epimerase